PPRQSRQRQWDPQASRSHLKGRELGVKTPMTRLLLNIATALVFFVAAAVAQSTPETDTPGTQGSSPSMGQGTSASSTGMQGTEYKGKGEKKLKGCIQSQGGSYVLQEKSGK